MNQRKLTLVMIMCVCASPLLFGQKNEVSFSVGGIFTSEQQTTVTLPCSLPSCFSTFNFLFRTNRGVGLESTYTRQLVNFRLASLYLELPLIGIPERGVPTSFTVSGLIGSGSTPASSASAIFFTPSAKVKFLESRRASPFVTLGGGFAHSNVNFNVLGNFREAGSNTGALQYGGGVDFKAPVPRLGFRAEVRDFYSASGIQPLSVPAQISISPVHLHHVFAGAGVFLRL